MPVTITEPNWIYENNNPALFEPANGTVTNRAPRQIHANQVLINNLLTQVEASLGTLTGNLSIPAINLALAGYHLAVNPTGTGLTWEANTAAGVTIGSVIMFAGTQIPVNYVGCLGAQVLKLGQFANLYSAIGDRWASVHPVLTPPDADKFRLPYMHNQYVMGSNQSGVAQHQASKQGTHTHILPELRSVQSFNQYGHTTAALGSRQKFIQGAFAPYVVPGYPAGQYITNGGTNLSDDGEIKVSAQRFLFIIKYKN
jgi:hypothetical protein